MSEETTPTVREVPHAEGPEKSVLSSILKTFGAILDEAPHLTAEHFHVPARKVMFEAITDSLAKGQSIELVAFVQRLHDASLLDAVGGAGGVTDIFTYAPNAAHFHSHVQILTDKLTLRKALKVVADITEAIDQGKEADEVAEIAASGATILSDAVSGAKPSSDTKALLRASAQRWEEMATGRENPMGIETSLVEINQLFRGLKPRRVTVISALPSHGKTLLGGQLFMDAVSQGNHGLFLTWEMTEDELIDRFVANMAKMPFDAISDPIKFAKEIEGKDKPSNEAMLRVKQAYRAISSLPLKIRAMHGQNISQAIAMIRREHRKTPLGIVAMDFAQRIGPSRHLEKQPYERQLADIADRFQNLAQELGFHGIVLSQLNKDGAAKHAEAINESCALHLKVVNVPETGRDGTPLTDDDGQPKIKVRGLGVVKDRFHGQTGNLLAIALNRQIQRFERIHN